MKFFPLTFRILFRVNLILAVTWIISYFLYKLLKLEFANTSHADNFFGFGIISIPVLALTYFLKNIKEQEHWFSILGKVLAGAFFTIIFLVLIAISTFGNMCSWTTSKVLYTNIKNPGIQIVERDFGCGATDSSPAIKRNFKIKKFAVVFFTATEVELADLDTSEWAYASNNSH